MRLEPAQFSQVCDRVMRSCMPVDFHHQQTWMDGWKSATDRMHYLHVSHFGLSDSLRALIRIRANLKKPNLHLDLIKPDVETLWNEIAARADESAHAYYNGENGFECCFLAVTGDSYITGSFVISRFMPHPARG